MKFILLIALLCPAVARAAVNEKEQTVSIELGGAMPFAHLSTDDQYVTPQIALNLGVLGGLQYLYQLDPHLGVGAGVQSTVFGQREVSASDGTGHNVSAWLMTYEALARYVLLPDAKINPYLIGGAGFSKVSVKAAGLEDDRFNSRLAISLGAGAETDLGRGVIAGLETRWRYLGNHYFPTSTPNTPPFGGSNVVFGGASEIMLALKLGYRFGG